MLVNYINILSSSHPPLPFLSLRLPSFSTLRTHTHTHTSWLYLNVIPSPETQLPQLGKIISYLPNLSPHQEVTQSYAAVCVCVWGGGGGVGGVYKRLIATVKLEPRLAGIMVLHCFHSNQSPCLPVPPHATVDVSNEVVQN